MATDFKADSGALRRPVRGEPWSRSVRLVDGKDVWSALDQCEARMQIRASSQETSVLKFDMTPHLIVEYGSGDEANDIRVTWSLTGQQTRESLQPGKYDLFLSDVGVTDARATRLLFGAIEVAPAVTTAEDEA